MCDQCNDAGHPVESCTTEALKMDAQSACSYIYTIYSGAKAVRCITTRCYTETGG